MKRALIFFALFASTFLQAQDDPIRLRLDASEAPHRLFHVQMTMPVKPGPLTLLYPKWIPGEHSPTGPITDVVGLRIAAGGQTVAWRRDPVNLYAFHLTVPDAAQSLDILFDFISPPDAGGFSSGASVTSQLAILSWNQFLLYPEGLPAEQIHYQATLRLPPSWRYGTALPVAHESGSDIEFLPATLVTLIDSPVSTGAHYRTMEIGRDGAIAHFLHISGDSDKAVEIRPSQLEHYQRLVRETGALFGSRHYRSYHFLLSLSDHVASFGLEHHESSDDRLGERALIDESSYRNNASLLPHEFVHSWNGKFRRPSGLITADYSQPMKGDLLWVYEGLTEYLGEVLAPRSGFGTAEDFLENLAIMAAALNEGAGRKWRSLEDTAISTQLLYDARDDYSAYRRGIDIYEEGALIWLDVDVTIRQLSHGTKSLDDFCRAFFAGPNGTPAVKSYTFEDLVAALNAVQSNDWSTFLRSRVQAVQPRAPLGGIENGGWKLVYNSTRPELWREAEEEKRNADFSYSLGLMVKDDGTVQDVAVGGLAQKAGIAPADKLVAVNNRQFSLSLLRDAVDRTSRGAETIELLLRSNEFYSVHRITYGGGERYPHLVRDERATDLITEILRPLAK